MISRRRLLSFGLFTAAVPKPRDLSLKDVRDYVEDPVTGIRMHFMTEWSPQARHDFEQAVRRLHDSAAARALAGQYATEWTPPPAAPGVAFRTGGHLCSQCGSMLEYFPHPSTFPRHIDRAWCGNCRALYLVTHQVDIGAIEVARDCDASLYWEMRKRV